MMDNTNNFYSIDRLVEFGMGTAIAGQMIQSMNQSIANMQIAGAGKPNQNMQGAVYYAAIDNSVNGPYSITEMARMVLEKKIAKETYIWKLGMKQWGLLENDMDILKLVALAPPSRS